MRRLCLAVLLLFSLFVTTVFADNEIVPNTNDTADSKVEEEIEKENSEGEDKEDPLYFNFALTDEQNILNLIEYNRIQHVSKAGNTIFLRTEYGRFRYIDDSGEMESYLKLNGYDIVRLNAAEIKPDSDNKASENTYSFGNMFLLGIAISLVVFLLSVAYRNAKAVKGFNVSSKPATDSTKSSDRKGNLESIPDVHFKDVEGVEELKADVFRLVDCLKNPDKYDDIGARTPKGVILYGPPGTGKTLLAKAIAGEAEVPFFSAVGSDFVEMYVGVGAKRVRELYKKARKAAPCIVFIDEIDAVASQRGKDDNSERDQTINALLAELDGFSSKEKIITICATNRLDMLDSAFKRAGRFDLKLAVGLPDKEGRYNILKIHSQNKKLAEDVDLEKIAVKCSGFSGAELETLLNEAAMVAVGREHKFINNDDIEDAFFKILLQGNKKPRKEIDEMNRIVAWHEAGHTLVTKLLTEDSVNSVTIIGSSSGAGGVTFRTPKQEFLHSKKYLRDSISIMYGGRAAEELYQGNPDLITTGASQDIKQATSIIKEYLSIYGMGDLGLIDITQLRTDYSDIIEEASELSKKIYSNTVELLRNNLDKLNALAERLLEKETLYEDEIDDIIATVAA